MINKNSQKINNCAYIDAANLHNGIAGFGWAIDYARFRVWLAEKYNVKTAYIFIGLIPRYKELYQYLQKCGFILIFKEVIYDGYGKPKGNCDADLVLLAVRGAYENKFNQAIIVSSDGDYASLIKFLQERGKLKIILSPHDKNKCSILLKRINAPITYIHNMRKFFERGKEKAPDADETA